MSMNSDLMGFENIDTTATQPAARSIEDIIMIIGAMKSGTTILYNYLKQHPQIAVGRKKELRFFLPEDSLSQGKQAYYEQFPRFDPSRHRYALEASPIYTKSQTTAVAKRIHAFGARFRFIYLMRHPVDRIESHLAHNIKKGRLDLAAAETKGVRAAIEASSYASQLDRFREGFGDPEILLLDFEELRRTPFTLLERCVDRFGLDRFNFRLVPPPVGRSTINRANEFRLSPERREAIAEALRPDVRALRDRYGFDVSGWDLV